MICRLMRLGAQMSDLPTNPPLTGADRLRAAVERARAAARSRPSPPAVAAPARPTPLAPVVAPKQFGPPVAAHQQPQAYFQPSGARPQPQPDLFRPVKKPAAPRRPKVAKEKVDVTARVLKALALPNPQHMLLCVPSDYSDCRAPISSLVGLQDGFRGLFLLRRTGTVEAVDLNKKIVNPAPHATIFEAPYKGYWSNIKQLRVELVDEDGAIVWLSVFNPWRQREKDPHGTILIEGELAQFGSKRYISGTSEPPPDVAGKVWVRYVRPGAPSETDVRALVLQALQDPDSFDAAVHSLVATSLLSEAQLLAIAERASGQRYASLHEFFEILHEPESPDDGSLAASAARAMAVAGICSAAHAANFRHPHPKAPLNISQGQVQQIIRSQSETLTADQTIAVQGLVSALRAPKPLNGLLSGDVGTGKTLVFAIPAVCAHLTGARVAIVSPTEILANQVAANLTRRFPQARVERVLAGGKIKDMDAILVGTSGLGSVAKKCGYVPNFLVIDEQHKLATEHRNSMVGPWTHQLEASATPIPRSLAATLFSGTQVFNLTQAPVLRNIESFVLDESERGVAVVWMREALAANHRVAVIYPRVEKTVDIADAVEKAVDAPDAPAVVNSVNAAADALQARFPDRVGKLHGKMTAEEVTQTLLDFREGRKPLVVASTIMETGIDIPDIRLLIVKDADNFGIAQLHQLRGRLARNGGSARFVMMVNDKVTLAPETAQRLATVQKVTDGYALAEADMATRGFGDLAGNAQSGNISCAFRLLRLGLDDFQV